jgi:uncharacterized protein (TIGR02145 family)
MSHRFLILTLIQFSLLLSQTQIAVVDFEALGVSSNDARALTNRLMIEMHRTNKFKVLEREMLDKVIEEQKFQLSGCNADQCLVELGQIANVQQIVGGTISKVGEVFTITARLISVESGEVVESALYDYEGKIGALMKHGMANVAAQLASIQDSLKSANNGKTEPHKKSLTKVEPSKLTSIFDISTPAPLREGTVIDVDGNIYQTVIIGEQEWMAENLKVTHYRNGDEIQTGLGEREWYRSTEGACAPYDNDFNNFEIYGLVYNGYAVSDERNIAPSGWHVATDAEWKEMEMHLGMTQSQADAIMQRGGLMGIKLKSIGNGGFPSSKSYKEDINISGFSALSGGMRSSNGSYRDINEGIVFWTASKSRKESNSLIYRTLHTQTFGVYRYYEEKSRGYYVRCIKD